MQGTSLMGNLGKNFSWLVVSRGSFLSYGGWATWGMGNLIEHSNLQAKLNLS
jgi:hypothetical protein